MSNPAALRRQLPRCQPSLLVRRRGPGFRIRFPWLLCAALLHLANPDCRAQLLFAEALSNNQSSLHDEEGDTPDWLELLNPSQQSIDLTGWSLTDDPSLPGKWTFENGLILPGEFRVVFASGKDRQPGPRSPLSPELVPGLILQLRASDVATNDAAQVRASGSLRYVRRWVDTRHRAGDAVQDDPVAQPLLARYQGFTVLRFDGKDDMLRLAQPPATNDFTVIAVARPTAGHEIDVESPTGVGGVSGQRWLLGAGHGGDAGAGAGLSLGTNGVSLYEHGSAYMPARCVVARNLPSGLHIISLTYSNRAPSMAVDGAVARSAGASSRNPVLAPHELGAGAYGAFAGEVAEILTYNRALAQAERESVESALAISYSASLVRNYHTSFRLSAGGESVQLIRPDGTVADQLSLPRLPPDISFGRPAGDPSGFAYFTQPTPGTANLTTSFASILSPPALSSAAGFYTNALQLVLTSTDPGATIHFTLDGSEPDESSPTYSAPLSITNRANAPNRFAGIQTAPGWSPPSGLVFKGTVVRARSYRSGSIPSDPVTATYFVHPKGRGRYSLPVVSLSTAPKNLFDPETGIYVPGNAPGGNYAQTGDAWERPVHVEMFETDGTRLISQEAGLRIHGNTSFYAPIKPLRLHALNQRGTRPFQGRLFPELDLEAFDRLLLRPSGQDYSLTMMRDTLMQAIVREVGLDQQASRAVVVFVDGEFWGLHHLQEAFEKNYFVRHHPGVTTDTLDYLEGYPPGTYAYEGDTSYFDTFFQSLAALPLETAAGYSKVVEHMDVGCFRDYKLAEIFYYRWDIGNHRLWRPREGDGRLRWILFDCDVGFGGFWSEPQPWSFDMLSAALTPSGTLHGHNNETTIHLLVQLLRNDGFRREFINRAADLMNTTFQSQRMLGFIDRRAAELSPCMAEHISRWRAPSAYSDWLGNVEALRTFARLRPSFMRQHLRDRFHLRDNVVLHLDPPSPDTGTVSLNSLDPVPFPASTNGAAGTTGFSGIYFRDFPIRLTAQPSAGWRFAGWLGLPGITNSTITLSLGQDFATAALFEPERALTLGRVTLTPGRRLSVEMSGPPGSRALLESSADLVLWRGTSEAIFDSSGSARTEIPANAIAEFLRLRR